MAAPGVDSASPAEAYNPEIGGPLFVDVPFIVRSTPPGARVYVDDREWGAQGTTPYSFRLFPGKHQIWIEADYHLVENVRVNVVELRSKDDVQTLDVALIREKVPVSIRTRPERAEVIYFSESGEPRALSKGHWEGVLPAGPAKFIVRQTGVGERTFDETLRRDAIDDSGRQSLEFNIRGDAELKMEAMMATGTLVIKSYLTGGAVTIDGKYVGVTRGPSNPSGTLRIELSPGVHRLVVSKDGFVPWVQNVSIRGKQETPIETPEILQPLDDGDTNVAGWVFSALGVAGLATGGYYTYRATQDEQNAEDLNLISYGAYGAGGGLLITGVLMFALGGDDAPSPVTVTLAPTWKGGGVVVGGEFE